MRKKNEGKKRRLGILANERKEGRKYGRKEVWKEEREVLEMGAKIGKVI